MHLQTWGSRFQGQPKEVGKGFRNAGGWLWIGWDSPRHSFPASRLWPRWPRATGVPTAPPLGKLRVDSSHRAQPSLRQLLHPQQATWDVPRATCSRGAGGPRALHCPLTSGSHAVAHGAWGHRRVRSPTNTHGAAVRGPGSRGPGTLRVDGDGLVGVSAKPALAGPEAPPPIREAPPPASCLPRLGSSVPPTQGARARRSLGPRAAEFEEGQGQMGETEAQNQSTVM